MSTANDRDSWLPLQEALTKRIKSDPAKFMHELATMLETPTIPVQQLTK